MKITKCPLSSAEEKNLDSIASCRSKNYEAGTCFCFMDDCLEAARYLHVQACGSGEVDGGQDDATTDNTTVKNNTEDVQTYDEILDEMFGLNTSDVVTEAITETTTLADNEGEALGLIDMNKYLKESGLDDSNTIVETGQYGVIFNGDLKLCNCSSELPEKILMKILMKNKHWNGLYSDKRTSAYKELDRNVEKELQLLIRSSAIQVARGRYPHSAREKIELEVDKFVDHGGLTAVLVKINITESHFDNTLRLETHFRTLAEKYNSWNGTGVFNKTFKGYSKNKFDPKLISAIRILPKEAAQARNITFLENEADPMDTIR